MKHDEHDVAADIGAALAVIVCGGMLYGASTLLIEKLADMICALLNTFISKL